MSERTMPAVTDRRARTLWITAIVLALGLVGAIGYSSWHIAHNSDPGAVSVSSPKFLRNGTRAPTNYALTILGGSSATKLQSLIAGRPAVINFFASWCTACAAELDAFAKVAANSNHVKFVGIDTNDFDHKQALALLHNAHATYPVLSDTSALSVATAYGVADLPMTFFVNAQGTIVDTVLGKESAKGLQARVTALAAGRRPH